ncbi:TPA: hypothetical protein ACVO3H_001331 [Vibrio diabolicus]
MKTKIIMSFLLATLCVSVSASTNEPKYHSALTVKTVFSEDRDKPVEVYYWYPTTNEKTTSRLVGVTFLNQSKRS